MDRFKVLSECELITDMSDEQIEKLSALGEELEFKVGDTLISKDDQSRDIFVIYDGWVADMQRFPYEKGSQRLQLLKNTDVVGGIFFHRPFEALGQREDRG